MLHTILVAIVDRDFERYNKVVDKFPEAKYLRMTGNPIELIQGRNLLKF